MLGNNQFSSIRGTEGHWWEPMNNAQFVCSMWQTMAWMAAGIAFACLASNNYWQFAKALQVFEECKQIAQSAANLILLRFPFKTFHESIM
jgi:hypothetical protein